MSDTQSSFTDRYGITWYCHYWYCHSVKAVFAFHIHKSRPYRMRRQAYFLCYWTHGVLLICVPFGLSAFSFYFLLHQFINLFTYLSTVCLSIPISIHLSWKFNQQSPLLSVLPAKSLCSVITVLRRLIAKAGIHLNGNSADLSMDNGVLCRQ